MPSDSIHATARAATGKLLDYCQARGWSGYDPYDALNSRILTALPFANRRVPRIALTQALKRTPVNIRPVLFVPKTENAKAIALFLSALVRLSRAEPEHGRLCGTLIERLIALRAHGSPRWCWGYSFPWQTRTVVVPAAAPNLVCTAFAANALLDAYEAEHDPRCLLMAVSAADYVRHELFWRDGAVSGFAYPTPASRVQVHNANFLGAALLCRVAGITGDSRLVGPALEVARWSASKQRADGSWDYGSESTQRWVDNFHTGYNLCALHAIGRHLGTAEFSACVRRGLEFYRSHFFRADGAPRYFHDRDYPVDIHCVAQSVITLLDLKDLDAENERLAEGTLRWAMARMWDERGFFYYRVLRFGTIRTSYMRWSQAWMLLALAVFAASSDAPAPAAERPAMRRRAQA
jgi:hypothetical protein